MAKIKKSDKKTRAEIQRAYRERLKAKNLDEARKKERDRWHKRRGLKTVVVIDDLCERDKRGLRRKWRLKKAEYRSRNRQQQQDAVETETPPSSVESAPFAERQSRGRKKVARNQRKAYRQVAMLTSRLEAETRVKERYKRRWLRLKVRAAEPERQDVGSVSSASLPEEPQAGPSHSVGAMSTPVCISTPRSKTRTLLRSVGSVGKVPCSVKKTLLYHNVMVEHVSSCKENRKAFSVPRGILKKYRLSHFARASGLPTTASTERNDVTCHGNAIDQETKLLVISFFQRDDNSRITTGKKQTVTKKKVKKQKRLLLDTIANLHEKFCAENSNSIISYISFTRLRPFWVRVPVAKDRDTCLCRKHENLQLLADKLYQLGILKSKYLEDVLQHICCDISERACMFRECEVCQGQTVHFQKNNVPQDDTVVVWPEWTTSNQDYTKDGQTKTAKITAKSIIRGTLKELKEKFNNNVCTDLARHVYIIRHQFRAYQSLKRSLQANEAVLHIDFSENYMCKNAAEIQSAHFGASNRQASIHTGVLYRTDGLQSFATISASWRHDPSAIWSHLHPVLSELRQTRPEVTDLHFFSDGPTPQYRNKQNFFLISTQVYKMGFLTASWNFFESGHGKGAPDAIGGTLKRQADSMVNLGFDIPDATTLFNALNKEESQIKLYFVEESSINMMDAGCSTSVKTIPGTMKMHQLFTDAELRIAYRNLSCFCTRPTICSCYGLHYSRFSAQRHEPVTSNVVVDAEFVTESITAGVCGADPGDVSDVNAGDLLMDVESVAAGVSGANIGDASDTNIGDVLVDVELITARVVGTNNGDVANQDSASSRRNIGVLSTKTFYAKSRSIDAEQPKPKRARRIPSRFQ